MAPANVWRDAVAVNAIVIVLEGADWHAGGVLETILRRTDALILQALPLAAVLVAHFRALAVEHLITVIAFAGSISVAATIRARALAVLAVLDDMLLQALVVV